MINNEWQSPNWQETGETIYNTNWNKYNKIDKYKSTIDKNDYINILTDKKNEYVYKRQRRKPIDPCTRGTHDDTSTKIFDVYKNGVIMPDQTGIIVTTLDSVIEYFYNQVDPVTEKPIEIPVEITIN